MTDNEINIAIAELAPSGGFVRDSFGCIVSPQSYTTDLNAMHEAEKVLIPEQLGTYAMWLVRLVETFQRLPSGWYPHAHYIWHATAAQRAEAFLRTLGKWKD